MRKYIAGALIVVFLALDALMFHDIFKPGEIYTTTEYLTGLLSLAVIAVSLTDLQAKR